MPPNRVVVFIFLASSFLIHSQEIIIEEFATGFDHPTNIQNAGDDRLFIVEQSGQIKILNPDGIVNATPFLDLSGMVSTNGERGLLGMAFHPDYTTNGYFYVDYSNLDGDNQISRFSVDATNSNIADTNSELQLLKITQPAYNHNGGCLAFGPDGYLYIASGDGGDSSATAQNTELLLGKLLRIDVDNSGGGNNYSIPVDNPFAGDPVNAEEIWAFGLRNPWKFSFDEITGNLWISDVGESTVEEINKVNSTDSGLNYGWNCYEGTEPYSPSGCPNPNELVFPVAEYTHDIGFSITGGYVYRGNVYSDIAGLYFFADGIGFIGSVNSSNTMVNYGSFGASWVSFGEDVNKELYLCNYSGTVYKLKGTELASNEEFNTTNFNLYPNPSKEFVTIQSETELIDSIAIFDINGRIIYSEDVSPKLFQTIDTSTFSVGLYLLKITSVKGDANMKKLIVN